MAVAVPAAVGVEVAGAVGLAVAVVVGDAVLPALHPGISSSPAASRSVRRCGLRIRVDSTCCTPARCPANRLTISQEEVARRSRHTHACNSSVLVLAGAASVKFWPATGCSSRGQPVLSVNPGGRSLRWPLSACLKEDNDVCKKHMPAFCGNMCSVTPARGGSFQRSRRSESLHYRPWRCFGFVHALRRY